MLTWTLILITVFPLYDMGRFQRRDFRRIERAERRVERKEVRENRRWQREGIELDIGLTDHRRAALNRHDP